MKLPFTIEQYIEVFKNYNTAVFPIQFVFYFIGLTAFYFTVKKNTLSGKIISAILSFFWLWMGVVYHFVFFTAINKAAYLFGSLFILQGILFLWKGVFQNKLSFEFRRDMYGTAAIILIVFALVIYPLTGFLLGHIYPSSPTFGLPCPTTIFSFGILLLSKERYMIVILIIPFIWSVIGFLAAFSLGIKEDISLLIAAVFTGIVVLKKKH